MSLGEQLAQAAIKIAKANCYLVGFSIVPKATEDDFREAYATLIELELQNTGLLPSELSQPVLDLAFTVLSQECYARFGVRLR